MGTMIRRLALFVALAAGMSSVAQIAVGPSRPTVVYNNWSAYDELSDTVPQTEQLCMRMLDEVIRLRKAGVQIDYYLMDAFWFDVSGGYRTWHRQHWPEGPDEWIKKCLDNGIVPGLWFSTNLISSGGNPMLNPLSEWGTSVTPGHSTVSLFEGAYLSHLMETLQMYADKGVGLFKFDFAYFDAASRSALSCMLPEEIVEANKTSFINALKLFRVKNPEILLIGYNGFGGDLEDTVHPFRKTVDSRWLEVFDTLYSGDPRLSDVPMMNFWRSQDVYSDRMVREFAFNGVPLHRIDNCSFMIGTTGTCYRRGTAAWRSSVILNMARGGWLNVYHGDIDLLDDADAAWLAKAQKLYLPLQEYGRTSLIGGVYGDVELYGYKSAVADGCLFTLINPTQTAETIDLGSFDARVLFRDSGASPTVEGSKITLRSEQMVVIGTGRFADIEFDLGKESDIRIPVSVTPIDHADVTVSGNKAIAKLAKAPVSTIRIIMRQLDENGKQFRTWGGGLPDGASMDSLFTIRACQKSRELPLHKEYGKVLWSGLSWAVAEIDFSGIDSSKPLEIVCTAHDGIPAIELYEIIYSESQQ